MTFEENYTYLLISLSDDSIRMFTVDGTLPLPSPRMKEKKPYARKYNTIKSLGCDLYIEDIRVLENKQFYYIPSAWGNSYAIALNTREAAQKAAKALYKKRIMELLYNGTIQERGLTHTYYNYILDKYKRVKKKISMQYPLYEYKDTSQQGLHIHRYI